MIDSNFMIADDALIDPFLRFRANNGHWASPPSNKVYHMLGKEKIVSTDCEI